MIDTFLNVQQRESVPVEIGEPGGIPEPLRERVGIDLQFGDELVLIRRDRREDGLGKDERTVLLLLQIRDGTGMFPPFHQMDPRLVPVHGVQHNLQQRKLPITKTNLIPVFSISVIICYFS